MGATRALHLRLPCRCFDRFLPTSDRIVRQVGMGTGNAAPQIYDPDFDFRPALVKEVTLCACNILVMTSPGTAAETCVVISLTAVGSSFDWRSAVNNPFVSCSTSVNWV